MHPPFSLTTIICENRLHKQVYNCFLRLTLLVIVVYIEHNKPFLVPLFTIALSLSLPPTTSPALGPPTSTSMDSYIPNISEAPVPIPYGELTFSAVEDHTNPHPITVTEPLQLHDFPETPQGAVVFQALSRVEEFLSHGCHNPDNTTPTCSLWLGFTTQLLAAIHNSICCTHVPDSHPHHFSSFSPSENTNFQLFASTISTLSTFLTNRQDDDSEPASHELCLRCLKECKVPVTKAEWEAVLLSCSQNIKAAHHTIINSKLHQLSEEMDSWVSNTQAHIKDAFINSVVNDDLPNFHDEHVTDARLVEWAARMKAAVRHTALAYITHEAIIDIVDLWVAKALEGAKALALAKNNTFLLNYSQDQRTLAEAKAISDANNFYTTTLAALKAEAVEHAERKVAIFKLDLKIKAEECKEALHLDSIKWIKEPSSSSTSVTCTNHTKQCADPTARPTCSRSVSQSRAPSPESQIPIALFDTLPLPVSRLPDQSTPQASPVVEFPLTHALTEPALSIQPPPTNIMVGPPKNSLEAVMLDVSMSQLPITIADPPPVVGSSFDPSTAGILSAIQGMISEAIQPLTSQVSVISSCCDTI